MDLRLQGRTALVTGGASRVGREIAVALAAEGAAVAVNYRSSAEEANAIVSEITEGGGKAVAIAADVADLQAVKAMVSRTVDELGGLDVLVNNAGLALRRPFVETTPDEWTRQIDVCMERFIVAMPPRHTSSRVAAEESSA
jgi:3-oxoacyl-[acyl-carrier protein] reductase